MSILRRLQRAAAKSRSAAAIAAERPTGLRDDEIIGLDHPLMTPELAKQLLGEKLVVPVEWATLEKAARLIVALGDPTGQQRKMISIEAAPEVIGLLNGTFDVAIRAAQEKNLRETGKARPAIGSSSLTAPVTAEQPSVSVTD